MHAYRRQPLAHTLVRGFALLIPLLAAGCQSPAASRPSAQPASQPAAGLPIRAQEIVRTIGGQPVHGWAAWVDLTDPRVEIRITGRVPLGPGDPSRMEARGETTLHWLERERLTLAVNALFFARVDDPNRPWEPNAPLDLEGPCFSDGVVVSPPPATQFSPVLVLDAQRHARIGLLSAAGLKDAYDVVSGLPATPAEASSVLVEHGRNAGATARVQPLVRHPRTAAGLTADGRTLILAVVDGRQPAWSVGMTLPELADLMRDLGAADAIALDGGGSSSFIFAPPDGPRITNRPSDGHWRAVGASLGVYLRPVP